MDTKTYDKLRDIVYQQSGISIKDGKMSMVASRIAKRLRALSLESELEYVEYLERAMDEEIVNLLDVISTNVTSFYREAHHFKILRGLMDDWLQQGQTRFRVWCAASSTGEEPYTLAMTMLDAARASGAQPDMKILATDISTRVLDEAKAGAYKAARVKAIPDEQRQRYMTCAGRGEQAVFTVKPALRDVVVFKRLNLAKPPFPMRGPLDVVFCRNVMIYFDQDVRNSLVSEFHRLLRPDGYLMVGHAESLQSSSHIFARAGTAMYQPARGSNGMREHGS